MIYLTKMPPLRCWNPRLSYKQGTGLEAIKRMNMPILDSIAEFTTVRQGRGVPLCGRSMDYSTPEISQEGRRFNALAKDFIFSGPG
jgi:hypothetical protein